MADQKKNNLGKAKSTNDDEKIMEHHLLDPYPIPKDKSTLYINDPWFIDPSHAPELVKDIEKYREPDKEKDNVRIYIPMDLNHKSILRRLDYVIDKYGEASEGNETWFSSEVDQVIEQLEIYDSVHYIRNMADGVREHSKEGIALAEDIIKHLEDIPDGCAELFPFTEIDELRKEYFGEDEK